MTDGWLLDLRHAVGLSGEPCGSGDGPARGVAFRRARKSTHR
jgi:hypothetical protein